jgi:cob(I)alamin adenosyltransferase
MKVYTRKGDDGTTGLLHGGRVAKDSPQPTAYGDVDEAQAVIGLVRAVADGELAGILIDIERDLWVVMAELACNPNRLDRLDEAGSRPSPAMVARLESLIDDVSARFEPPTEFVVPGEDEVSARLDVARAVCRRAERSALSAVAPGSSVVPYLNRLSDLLWTLARWSEGTSVTARSLGDPD